MFLGVHRLSYDVHLGGYVGFSLEIGPFATGLPSTAGMTGTLQMGGFSLDRRRSESEHPPARRHLLTCNSSVFVPTVRRPASQVNFADNQERPLGRPGPEKFRPQVHIPYHRLDVPA